MYPKISIHRRNAGSFWATSADAAKVLSALTSANRHRNPTLRVSPTRVLALRVHRRHPEQVKRFSPMYQTLARMSNERLPVITFQRLLQTQDLTSENKLSKIVQQTNPVVWKDRMNSLESRGWKQSDIDHWVWILSADDIDARVDRFVSKGKRKPLFVLLTILQDASPIQSAVTIKKLLVHVESYYCSPLPDGQKKDVNQRLEMTFGCFTVFLRRLIRHVRKVQHSSILALAELTRRYIQYLPAIEPARVVYRRRCKIFNDALYLFSQPAQISPLKNMEFNWEAQKKLLAMSDAMHNPLVIDRRSYKAIRKVLLALQKSQAERAVARRYAHSWPPYRQDFDGHDTQRTPDDDLSRSVKAGTLMTEAGYEKDDYDRALDALGGSYEGSPTIQTRSLAPTEWKQKGDQDKDNFFTMWAMKVRATRNAQEAWKAFTEFASTDTKPTLQVYTEMFMKLQAGAIDDSRDVLPGDTRETFPVHHGNYSEYELARQTPPTVRELYQHMRHEGVKPGGMCLEHLVSNASSLADGQQYLLDGGVNPALVAHLAQETDLSTRFLQKMPLLLFKSYVQLLCRLHPNRRGRDAIPAEELSYIHQAIRLTKARLPHATAAGASFRPPWQIICRTLARADLALGNGERVASDTAALHLFLKVQKWLSFTIGMDHEVLLYLCRTVQKLAISHIEQRAHTHSSADILHETTGVGYLFRDAHERLQASSAKLRIANSERPLDSELPHFLYSITPVYLHTYMRTLAFLGDVEGMVGLMDWMLANKDLVVMEARRKSGDGGQVMLVKVLCAFEAFAGPQLDVDTRRALNAKLEQVRDTDRSWGWPSPEDVEAYVQSDRRGGSQTLRRMIVAARRQKEPLKRALSGHLQTAVDATG